MLICKTKIFQHFQNKEILEVLKNNYIPEKRNTLLTLKKLLVLLLSWSGLIWSFIRRVNKLDIYLRNLSKYWLLWYVAIWRLVSLGMSQQLDIIIIIVIFVLFFLHFNRKFTSGATT